MATELATGYITLIPSARGITAGIQKELGAPVAAASRKSGAASSSAFSSSFSKGTSQVRSALLGAIGAASVVQAVRSVAQATDGLESSQALLVNSLHQSGQGAKAFDTILGPLLKKNEQWGFTNSQVNDSLATLTRSGAKAKSAVTDEAIAANFAAARHVSLAAATQVVSKVVTNHVALLGRYGIATKDSTGKTISQAAALKLLGQRFGGAASANAATFGGKIHALHAQFTDVEATIGQKAIPILVKLGIGLASVVGWFQKGSSSAHAVEVVIAASVAGFLAYKAAVLAQAAATAIATTAQKLFGDATEVTDAALEANPIGLVVAALVGLGVVIFEAYKHWGPFHTAVDAVWSILKASFTWVKTNWPLLLAILTGPFGVAALLIIRNWSSITGFFSALPGRIRRAVGVVTAVLIAPFVTAYNWVSQHVFGPLVSWFSGLGGKIGRFVGSIASAITSPFRSAFNAIARLWNSTVGKLSFHVPRWVPGIGGDGFSVPKIPILDTGGVITGPTVALLAAGAKAQPEIASPVRLMAETFRSELQRTGAGRPIDARTIVQGNVYGDAHLQSILDDHDRNLELTLAAG